MQKKSFLLMFLLTSFLAAKADHIAGGALSYTYVGTANGKHEYSVLLKLYRNCNADRDFDNTIVVSVFNKGTSSRVSDNSVGLARRETSGLTQPNPCITNPPTVCLEIAYYTVTLSLAGSPAGYVLATQVNFRADDMNNLITGYDQVGATYVAEIPGTATAANGPVNNSASFTASDLEVLCTSNRFSYSFAAEDKDGDALRYVLCNAYETTGGRGGAVTASSAPPFSSVPYGNGFRGNTPLGNTVRIDAATGLITGTAPATGTYVIAVCVEEMRNGVVIATQRKDIQVRTSSCTIAAAQLLPQYALCRESYNISIPNLSTSTLIDSYNWSLANNRGAVVYTSTNTTLEHTFADTGTYTLKLVVATSNGCADSTTSSIVVYPGLRTGFLVAGSCYQTPFQFTDTSRTPFGAVASWQWDLGDAGTADVFDTKSLTYQYNTIGNYTASLIVTTDKGCSDTLTKTITVSDKPLLELPFRDTLICSIDTLQLQAIGNGDFSWTPNPTISNTHTAMPSVYPKSTTTYMVTLTEQGCIAQDSVKVAVVDFITVQLPADTTICSGDSFQLIPVSQGLHYAWSPQSGLSNAFTKSPIATVSQNTTYTVKANVGKCIDEATIAVTVAPYPDVDAGRDTLICYGTPAQLQGAVTAASFAWSPAAMLTASNTLTPLATPVQTTAYVLTATNRAGCLKPASDTVLVRVLPRVDVFAGNDTNLVAGQRLQLQASGGDSYQWTPPAGLSSTTIANPVVTLNGTPDLITYVVTARVENCAASDSITVRIFKTGADIFVPTAFTPNGDGRNDDIKPILVGMKSLDYFKIYNRWGQMVFSTTTAGRGWDGRLRSVAQKTEVFVYMAQGIDYTGRKVFRKGTLTLIR